MTTVKELIEKLKEYPGDMVVSVWVSEDVVTDKISINSERGFAKVFLGKDYKIYPSEYSGEYEIKRGCYVGPGCAGWLEREMLVICKDDSHYNIAALNKKS